ncbi:MAG TPA: beta-L-arabinofuranosidase domain-containing protein [Planctomycetota bacterium]|nr:beta-L-arabinofuranosidase domain-containing protein [Planctomycetota bacterium]
MQSSLAILALGVASVAIAGTHAKLVPVKFTDVRIADAFWAPRIEVNRTKSIPHVLEQCEKTGRINNFAYIAKESKEAFRGHVFHDSDVVKVLEGVAHSLATHPDKALEARLEQIIGWMAKGQQPDGYLNTYFIAKGLDKRWTGLQHAHELYCAGHMFEAAVAHYEATGRKTFLDVASKYADHIDSVFGPTKRHGIAGHPEIELALVKLWRATGEERYLKLAQFLVEEHGQPTHKLFGTYCQDHKPIREQDEAVGHCVRAMYLYSGVTDLAMITGDQGYIDALEKLWQDIVTRKMYITGSIGVQRHGEGFAQPYLLPNYDAYCETCAAIGMVFWNHRMMLLKGEGRFADIVERNLYNGLMSAVSLDGMKCFYVNPLASRGNLHRSPWHGCSCCPTNMVRFLPALGQYVYAASAAGDAVYVAHYVAGSGVVALKDGKVKLTQKTRYPWDGGVQIGVEPQGISDFAVCVRIPDWCEGATAKLNGQAIETKPDKGFVAIRRTWKAGDVVELELPMPIRQVAAAPEVADDVGRLAIQRGPIVYCLEGCDHSTSVSQIAIQKGAKLEAKSEPDLLGGVVVIKGQGQRQGFELKDDGSIAQASGTVDITAVPYFAWDNREPGEMVVWVPAELPAASKPENVTIAIFAKTSASHQWQADHIRALNDGLLPKNSIDHDVPRFTWWDHKGTTEWVGYEFDKAVPLARAEVYWFDDTGKGGCRVPKSWRLLWRDGNDWKPVEAAGAYGVEKDKLNAVAFKPVTTKSLRLEVELQPGFSGGILEWRVSK